MEPLTGQSLTVNPSGRLTGRDVDILKFIAENRFATTRTLADQFWKGNGNWNHHRRLRILRKRGLLEPLVGDRGMRIGYRATRKGWNILQGLKISISTGGETACRYRTTLDHDDMLITLRRILSTSPVIAEFMPEHDVREMLSRKYGYEDRSETGYKIPDALFRLKTSKRTYRVALELEIAKKSRARYLHILKRLSLSPDWDIVFIIAARDLTIGVLKEVLADVKENDLEMKVAKARHGIYFIQLADFLRDRLAGKFVGEGKTITLRQFEKDWTGIPGPEAEKS